MSLVTSFDDLITDPLNYLFKVGSEKKARERRDIESQKVFAKSEVELASIAPANVAAPATFTSSSSV